MLLVDLLAVRITGPLALLITLGIRMTPRRIASTHSEQDSQQRGHDNGGESHVAAFAVPHSAHAMRLGR